ncbi:unnamed protein product [Microthlaspi erraticum]|uniref:F-box domain-containing protein n=1 Tax=Microthlaspi erraticum TaxID=1685480 RepID=A0A6D2ILB4_9BRAS|nr:unnamed protein product [Microthlaspi erraticum]
MFELAQQSLQILYYGVSQPPSTSRKPSSCNASKGENSAESIPVDLIIEILLKLPLASIASCRCVSKLWDSTIRLPHFTESILARSKLLFACKRDGNMCFFSSSQPQNPDENSSPIAADYQSSFNFCGDGRKLSRPVHGLIILKYYKKETKERVMEICNPSSGQSLTLPKVKTVRVDVCSFFGYDPVDKKFKVLSMTKLRSRGDKRTTEHHQVLTLGGTRKLSWRMIECSLPHYPLSDGICINGVLYYKAEVYRFQSRFQCRYGIICFYIRSEKFKFIEKQLLPSKLLNYMGKLAILKWDDDFKMVIRSNSLELCVLEDRKKHEWSTRTFVLPALWNDVVADVTLDIVGVTRGGEIVFSPLHSSDLLFLIYYNPERSTLTKVDIQGMDAFKHCIVHTFLDHVM